MSTPLEDLKTIVPHLWLGVQAALEDGPPGCTAKLAIIQANPDGSGKIMQTFFAEEFLQALASVVGLPPLEPIPPEEAQAEYSAAKLVSAIRGR